VIICYSNNRKLIELENLFGGSKLQEMWYGKSNSARLSQQSIAVVCRKLKSFLMAIRCWRTQVNLLSKFHAFSGVLCPHLFVHL
jgi:hypothetical protein